jgi:hypothetical protein
MPARGQHRGGRHLPSAGGRERDQPVELSRGRGHRDQQVVPPEDGLGRVSREQHAILPGAERIEVHGAASPGGLRPRHRSPAQGRRDELARARHLSLGARCGHRPHAPGGPVPRPQHPVAEVGHRVELGPDQPAAVGLPPGDLVLSGVGEGGDPLLVAGAAVDAHHPRPSPAADAGEHRSAVGGDRERVRLPSAGGPHDAAAERVPPGRGEPHLTVVRAQDQRRRRRCRAGRGRTRTSLRAAAR